MKTMIARRAASLLGLVALFFSTLGGCVSPPPGGPPVTGRFLGFEDRLDLDGLQLQGLAQGEVLADQDRQLRADLRGLGELDASAGVRQLEQRGRMLEEARTDPDRMANQSALTSAALGAPIDLVEQNQAHGPRMDGASDHERRAHPAQLGEHRLAGVVGDREGVRPAREIRSRAFEEACSRHDQDRGVRDLVRGRHPRAPVDLDGDGKGFEGLHELGQLARALDHDRAVVPLFAAGLTHEVALPLPANRVFRGPTDISVGALPHITIRPFGLPSDAPPEESGASARNP